MSDLRGVLQRVHPVAIAGGLLVVALVLALGISLGTRGNDDADYTQWFVEQALDRYERDGQAATVEYHNTPESVDGQWYVFVIDENETMLAHANPDLVDTDANEIRTADGYPAGSMVLAAATDEGAWLTYHFLNLQSGLTEVKHSWVVRRDGLTFGSGWYEDGPSPEDDPAAYAQSFVERAIEMYRVLGRDAVLEYYNDESSVQGEWYVYIIQADGIRLAHPTVLRDQIGENILDAGPDLTGKDFRAETLAIEDEGWVDYVFENPATGQPAQKHSWIVRHDGLLFGTGWYEPGVYELFEDG